MAEKKLTVRLDPELRPAVEKFAEDSRWSANASVNFLVEYALRKIEEERPHQTKKQG